MWKADIGKYNSYSAISFKASCIREAFKVAQELAKEKNQEVIQLFYDDKLVWDYLNGVSI